MGLKNSVLWGTAQADPATISSTVVSDTLEQLADEAMRLDAFEKQAKQYNITVDYIAPDLPMEVQIYLANIFQLIKQTQCHHENNLTNKVAGAS